MSNFFFFLSISATCIECLMETNEFYFVPILIGSGLTKAMISDIMKEMPPLISENDLHVSQVSSIVHFCYLI